MGILAWGVLGVSAGLLLFGVLFLTIFTFLGGDPSGYFWSRLFPIYEAPVFPVADFLIEVLDIRFSFQGGWIPALAAMFFPYFLYGIYVGLHRKKGSWKKALLKVILVQLGLMFLVLACLALK